MSHTIEKSDDIKTKKQLQWKNLEQLRFKKVKTNQTDEIFPELFFKTYKQ